MTARIIICGGRNFYDWERFQKTMNSLHHMWHISEVIEGGAKGADELAMRWARELGIKHTQVKAHWNELGRAAGYHRNVAMADLRPDAVVAFPGGKGTEMMVRIANSRGMKVVRA